MDRHIENGDGDKVAYYWEGNDVHEESKITYKELHEKVCQMANVLKKNGVKKGDTVSIYMPMILELPITILACARIGAVHSVVFAGFSSTNLATRIMDGKSKIIITADGFPRGNKYIHIKDIVDEALEHCKKDFQYEVNHVLVFKRAGDKIKTHMARHRDIWVENEIQHVNKQCDIEWMDAEDPLFILYTSGKSLIKFNIGSTGKPKGVLHTCGGYMVYVATTMKYVFDIQKGDVYWCTADIGWITGHSYIVYGPLLNGVTSVMFEGIPTYPDPGRFWQICDKLKVTQFYTAPTAIRSLQGFGDDLVKKYKLDSLRVLGSVGEPINPAAWEWYYNIVGKKNCPIMDTWWQTETGGQLITPLPCLPLVPGSALYPFFGIQPALMDTHGKEIKEHPGHGVLVIKKPWPGIMRSLFGDHERFEKSYFSAYPGYYDTGDGCTTNEEGLFTITGRTDDVLKVSGHRIGSAEIESALVSHPLIIEAAVVGVPHDIKGEAIYAYVTPAEGVELTPHLKKELEEHVRKVFGPIGKPEHLHYAPNLPKTRSGKIMRRILRKIAIGDHSNFGDVSTLADPHVIDVLIKYKK